MHLISTSVCSGSVLTATHLQSPTLVSNKKEIETENDNNARSRWFDLAPVLSIDLVHLGEILHVG